MDRPKFLTSLHRFIPEFGTLVVAVGLWMFVSANTFRVDVAPFAVILGVTGLDPRLALTEPLPEPHVVLRAPRSYWPRITPESFKVRLDLTGRVSGRHELPLTVEATDESVEIISLSPRSLMVHLAANQEKKIPVTVSLEGSLGEGYQATDLTALPREVVVRGAAPLIEKITEANVVAKLQGEVADVEGRGSVAARDELGRIIVPVVLDPSEVTYEVSVARSHNAKSVGVRLTTSGRLPSDLFISSVIVEPSLIDITGKAEDLATIDTIATEALNLNQINKRTVVKVPLKLPTTVTLVNPSQLPEVTVTIAVDAFEVSKEVPLTVKFNFLRPDLSATNVTSVTALVKGTRALVEGLNGDNFFVAFDMSNRGSGSHFLPLTPAMVQKPASISIEEVSPNIVYVLLVAR